MCKRCIQLVTTITTIVTINTTTTVAAVAIIIIIIIIIIISSSGGAGSKHINKHHLVQENIRNSLDIINNVPLKNKDVAEEHNSRAYKHSMRADLCRKLFKDS